MALRRRIQNRMTKDPLRNPLIQQLQTHGYKHTPIDLSVNRLHRSFKEYLSQWADSAMTITSLN